METVGLSSDILVVASCAHIGHCAILEILVGHHKPWEWLPGPVIQASAADVGVISFPLIPVIAAFEVACREQPNPGLRNSGDTHLSAPPVG